MKDDPNGIDLAAQAVSNERWQTPPTVSPLRSDVRSGENFLIVTTGNLPSLFIGPVIVEWGFEVPREQADTFHTWLANNEKSLSAECPTSVQYRGTYAVFAQSSQLGSYRTIWAFDSLDCMELLGKEVASGSSLGKRIQQLTRFRDESIGSSRSQQIYHPAATAVRT